MMILNLISQGLIPHSSAAQQTNDERSESRADTPYACSGVVHFRMAVEPGYAPVSDWQTSSDDLWEMPLIWIRLLLNLKVTSYPPSIALRKETPRPDILWPEQGNL